MTSPRVDPSRCPLCGGSNKCGIQSGAGDCWCFTASVPAEVLDRVDPELRGVACVCERCALGRLDPATLPAAIEK